MPPFFDFDHLFRDFVESDPLAWSCYFLIVFCDLDFDDTYRVVRDSSS